MVSPHHMLVFTQDKTDTLFPKERVPFISAQSRLSTELCPPCHLGARICPPSQDMRSSRRAVLPFLTQAPVHRWGLCDLSQATLCLPCGLRSRSPVQTGGSHALVCRAHSRASPCCPRFTDLASLLLPAAPHGPGAAPSDAHRTTFKRNVQQRESVRGKKPGGGRRSASRRQGHPRDLTFALLSEINSPARAVRVDIWARTSATVQRSPGGQRGAGCLLLII